MRHPSIKDLAEPLRATALHVAQELLSHGHRAWLVGGSVRDLALGTSPKDVDLATAAHPDEIEAWFPRTVDVGKAFGTVRVRTATGEAEVTTFRRERGYADGRRPSEVEFGTTVEEDARRRDFTANALYLDPLTDEHRDPTGGLVDIERRCLRCVGRAVERFEEDGLRIVRLARFAARLDFRVEDETLAAARASLDALRGVSVERLLDELTRIASQPRAWTAVRLLLETGALERVLPDADAAALRVSCELLERLGGAPGPALFLAVLLDPDAGRDPERVSARIQTELTRLRASRSLQREVAAVAVVATELLLLADDELAFADAARRRRLQREDAFPDALRLARLRETLAPESAARLARLGEEREALTTVELHPPPLLRGGDLEALGLRPGPRFAELLREAEDRQLRGELRERDDALRWLAARTDGESS